MLQFIAEYNEKYSIPEQAQMAIEGGCKWIILRVPEMPDEEIREIGTELVPLCKETSTILTIENHLDMAKELGLHGVQLRNSRVSPAEARELLGPEAIIGVVYEMASQALALGAIDVDYVAFNVPIPRLGEYVETLRNEKFMLPIVAEGNDYDIVDAQEAIAQGVSGVAIGQGIINAADPVTATEKLILALQN